LSLGRRQFLRLAALATLARPSLGWADARPRKGPRRYLSVLLSGGIDAVYSADPKTRAEVEPWVDVPYPASAIVEAGGLLLGPHFAPLAPFAKRLAILKGVRVRTANHNTGTEQFARMKTNTVPEMPTLLQILGEQKEGEAVGCMGWTYGAPQFTRLFQDTPPEDLLRMAFALKNQAHGLRMDPRPASHVTQKSVEESAALLERMARAPAFKPEVWSPDEFAQHVAASLQRVLWVFENDLARAYELNVGGIDQPWDSHTFNTERQTDSAKAIPMLARFLAELEARKTSRGPLAAETLVVVGSELGRYPATNRQSGKDHFPEVPLLFYGAGVRGGAAFGTTGKRMEALPVSVRTGRAAPGGDGIALDDVGTTLLHAAGVSDPAAFGYSGRVLEFLVGA
jgi:uncharacterized protein (DUF1501 family)